MKSTRQVIPKYLSTRHTDANGCILCDNVKNQDGYVRVGCPIEKRSKMLHIIEWEKINGHKPKGMELNHICRNRACCNVEHLELIDGSAHATLTNVNRVGYKSNRKSVQEIANLYYLVIFENVSINKVCKDYDIKRSTLSSIINKRSRKNITDKVDETYKTLYTPK